MSLVTTLACLSILLLQAAAYVRERVYDTQGQGVHRLRGDARACSGSGRRVRRRDARIRTRGASYSDFGLGTAERTRRRLPGRRVIIISMLPVADLDALAPSGEELQRADYLVYTVK